MKEFLSIVIFSFLSFSLLSQEWNQVDAAGKKQGKWHKFHESSKTVPFYEGQFKDDIRVGHWVYFYSNGAKKSDVHFSQGGTVAYSKLYDQKGVQLAYGKYVNEKKDSVWTFYGANGKVSGIEGWQNGEKHGLEESYFPDGAVLETYNWTQGKRDGPFKEFHSAGVLSVEGAYAMDEYEGQMTFYYPNGKKEIEGKYVNGFRESTWRYYNKDGSIHYQIVYRSGNIIKEKKENGLFEELNPDNSIVSSITYEKGLKHGPYLLYHPAGQAVKKEVRDPMTGQVDIKLIPPPPVVKIEGQYKNDKQHGSWKEYNEIGKLIGTKEYIDGVLQ